MNVSDDQIKQAVVDNVLSLLFDGDSEYAADALEVANAVVRQLNQVSCKACEGSGVLSDPLRECDYCV